MTTGIGTFTIDKESFDSIASQSGGLGISIEISKAGDDEMNAAQKSAIGNREAYSFNIYSDAKQITQFGGNYIKVSVSYQPKANEDVKEKYVMKYIDGNGTNLSLSSQNLMDAI